jgi:hypothetical protein
MLQVISGRKGERIEWNIIRHWGRNNPEVQEHDQVSEPGGLKVVVRGQRGNKELLKGKGITCSGP